MSDIIKPDYPFARVHLSPNCEARRDDKKPSLLIMHYTALETGDGAESWMVNPKSKVSAHYLIYEDGKVLQLVLESKRAWHAGKSYWKGETDINSCSIGIEISNSGFSDYPEAQIHAVIALGLDICKRHPAIRPERVLGHSDIAVGRKIDPGPKFPWGELYKAGLGHWVKPVSITDEQYAARGDRGEKVKTLQTKLAAYGYKVTVDGVFGSGTQNAVKAFQLHFRPQKADGIADMSTIGTLNNLISKLAVPSV